MSTALTTPTTGLTPAQFYRLKDVPPEAEWFANIPTPNTRRAYRIDIEDFRRFAGIGQAEDFRTIDRAHVIAWREELVQRGLANDTIRRKLAALSSLYSYLCEKNALLLNPVLGVKRPRSMNREGTTPALGDAQARLLLDAPSAETLQGKRDRAILATLLYHGLRREELCTLRVRDVESRRGVKHLRVEGKGSKVRYVTLAIEPQRLLDEYLEVAGHGQDLDGPLFRPLKNNVTGTLAKALHCIGSLLLCDLNLQTQIRLACIQGAKNLDQLSVNCCRVLTMTRYKTETMLSVMSYSNRKGCVDKALWAMPNPWAGRGAATAIRVAHLTPYGNRASHGSLRCSLHAGNIY